MKLGENEYVGNMFAFLLQPSGSRDQTEFDTL